ncbi:zinc finger protein 395-like isoform X1 [Sinocyclocheilus anshuiensis]|uniref:Zinc finger protein 395-like n=1 Tax=Sinocyclocheilus anshuiensis TaxID=1608454 RepID=A0A671SSV9_9TELE|nr:PREDICTED: zinc finger protein 395-like isoform X1 [Sinocyclocheilus anshuiensis]XP_016332331.1 PREDICTED: zinc finger protein 395-like isoform X1 [Sinocyclocheilus anshuiensis]
MVPKTRLGKRSPLGTLVCGSSAEGLTETGPLGCPDSGPHRSKLYPGQKVYVHCGGQECGGVVEQHNHVDNEVSIFLPQLNQHVHRKLEDVWTSPTSSHTSSVSSSIDVPRRSPETVDMDEIMAAMVLTSLSCSPVIQHSAQGSATQASCGIENGGGELYDGGYWSCDHGNGSPAPSPPIAEMDKSAPLVDEGLDMELDQMLFNEPTPRKRKNSVKVAYRCLWPNCGKILTTVVGIKRHIRNSHLGQSDEHSQREEDFYYTEVYQDLEQITPSGGHRPSCTSPSSPSWHTPPSPTTPEMLQPSPLSQSAPGSFWQVHSEHSYQAPPPIQVVTPSKPVSVPVSCHWTPSLTVHQSKQGSPFRRRSVSVGEQWLQNNNATFRPLPACVSPPRNHCTSRRIRGEAKKCRKVYGIEHRDQWCTACRWKKACQRFLD